MLKAKDIMTKHVISVSEDTPIFEAVELLATNKVTGIPVVNDDLALVGILSEQDVLRLFHTHEEERDKPVSDFMTQPAIYFDENESLPEVCDCLINNPFRRVPVTSKGKVVGIISRRDLIKHILQLKEETPALAEVSK